MRRSLFISLIVASLVIAFYATFVHTNNSNSFTRQDLVNLLTSEKFSGINEEVVQAIRLADSSFYNIYPQLVAVTSNRTANLNTYPLSCLLALLFIGVSDTHSYEQNKAALLAFFNNYSTTHTDAELFKSVCELLARRTSVFDSNDIRQIAQLQASKLLTLSDNTNGSSVSCPRLLEIFPELKTAEIDADQNLVRLPSEYEEAAINEE